MPQDFHISVLILWTPALQKRLPSIVSLLQSRAALPEGVQVLLAAPRGTQTGAPQVAGLTVWYHDPRLNETEVLRALQAEAAAPLSLLYVRKSTTFPTGWDAEAVRRAHNYPPYESPLYFAWPNGVTVCCLRNELMPTL